MSDTMTRVDFLHNLNLCVDCLQVRMFAPSFFEYHIDISTTSNHLTASYQLTIYNHRTTSSLNHITTISDHSAASSKTTFPKTTTPTMSDQTPKNNTTKEENTSAPPSPTSTESTIFFTPEETPVQNPALTIPSTLTGATLPNLSNFPTASTPNTPTQATTPTRHDRHSPPLSARAPRSPDHDSTAPMRLTPRRVNCSGLMADYSPPQSRDPESIASLARLSIEETIAPCRVLRYRRRRQRPGPRK